eukprot:6791864-Lingulodinium_polyedra.AAC.2
MHLRPHGADAWITTRSRALCRAPRPSRRACTAPRLTRPGPSRPSCRRSPPSPAWGRPTA